ACILWVAVTRMRSMKTPLRISLGVMVALLTTAAWAQDGKTYRSQKHDFRVVTVAQGLEYPWCIAFLPDGRKLVTERAGRLRVIDAGGTLLPRAVEGVPKVVARGQGGL